MIVNTLHAVYDLMLDSLVIAATVASQFDRSFRFAAEIAINAPFKNQDISFPWIQFTSNKRRDDPVYIIPYVRSIRII